MTTNCPIRPRASSDPDARRHRDRHQLEEDGLAAGRVRGDVLEVQLLVGPVRQHEEPVERPRRDVGAGSLHAVRRHRRQPVGGRAGRVERRTGVEDHPERAQGQVGRVLVGCAGRDPHHGVLLHRPDPEGRQGRAGATTASTSVERTKARLRTRTRYSRRATSRRCGRTGGGRRGAPAESAAPASGPRAPGAQGCRRRGRPDRRLRARARGRTTMPRPPTRPVAAGSPATMPPATCRPAAAGAPAPKVPVGGGLQSRHDLELPARRRPDDPPPIHADREARTLRIEWADGHVSMYDFDRLRWLCPCAYCRGEMGQPGLARLEPDPHGRADPARLDRAGRRATPSRRPGATVTTPATTRSPRCAPTARAPPARPPAPPPATDAAPRRRIAMIVATTPYIAGHRVVETKGMVFGLVVRSRGLGGNIMAGLRSIGGGEIHEYTDAARGHPPPGDRPAGPERHADGRQRGHLDALRQLRDGGHDVRDRGLRDRRRGRCRDAAADHARSSSRRWAARSASVRRGRHGRPRDRPLLVLAGLVVLVVSGGEAACRRVLARRHRAGPPRSPSLLSSGSATGASRRSAPAHAAGPGGGESRGLAHGAALPAHRRGLRGPDEPAARCASGWTRPRASGGTAPRSDRPPRAVAPVAGPRAALLGRPERSGACYAFRSAPPRHRRRAPLEDHPPPA